MFSKIKNDIPSAIVVFIVALPLCLGIALASGAPLIAGLMTGIVGGIVVGLISGSHTSVSGPAAGLIPVVIASMAAVGGNFDVFLGVVVVAGVFQLGFGLLRSGFIASYIPSNIIKGLLAAIGIILIMKQIPHAVGFDRDAEGDFSFLQADGENTFSDILLITKYFSIGSIIISVVSMLVLIYWDKTPLKKLKFFPASLAVVFIGIGLNYVFQTFNPSMAVLPSHLVTLPKVSLGNLRESLHFPVLSAFLMPQVWLSGLILAIVASVEALLNVQAVDNLDEQKRQSPPNKELIAQGIGNIVVGFLGGLPITSEVVRGSVNVYAGAQTKASTILHGALLLLSILVLTPFLNVIPLASLAAVLIMTGYRLTRPAVYREMLDKGWNQFIPFVVTVAAIVFTDLLTGIIIGMFVSVFFILRSNYKNPFTVETVKHVNETIHIELSSQVSFLNKASIKDTLWNIPSDSKVVIDASGTEYIDHDVQELLRDFKNVLAPERNITLNMIGLKNQYIASDHVQFVNVVDKETQAQLSPAEVVDILRSGNDRFVTGKSVNTRYFHQQIDATAYQQHPMAVVLGCIDSRTSPELVFDSGLGDILSTRIAGNIVSPEVIGSLELACGKIGSKLIVIMGHSNCGAVASAIHNVKHDNIGYVTAKIRPAVYTMQAMADGSKAEFEKAVTIQNIKNSVTEIMYNSSLLSDMIRSGEVGIVAAYYDTETGLVTFYDNMAAQQPAAA